MADVELSKLTKIFEGSVRAVTELTLRIDDGELLAIVGPSGCGKTTTLRTIAGLEEPTSGTIRIGERLVNGVPPRDRDVAMVFQNYALYPHLNVHQNLAFGSLLRRPHALWDNLFAFVVAHGRWRQARTERAALDEQVRQAAAKLGLDDLLHRRPADLSGGERQRVALGRAIVRRPQVFLFDEPLSNLDARLRVTVRTELKRLHRHLRTTAIYVTHDQEEAMTLGDRVAVLRAGVLQQCGRPDEIYDRPANRFVAGFVGSPPMNFFEGRLANSADELVFDDRGIRVPLVAGQRERLALHVEQTVLLGVRPESLHLAGPDSVTSFPARVVLVETLGDRRHVHCATERGTPVVWRCDRRVHLAEGDLIHLGIDTHSALYFAPGEHGPNLRR